MELIASGSGIDACAWRPAPRYANTKLNIPKEGRVSAQEVFALPDTDSLCGELTENAANALSNHRPGMRPGGQWRTFFC